MSTLPVGTTCCWNSSFNRSARTLNVLRHPARAVVNVLEMFVGWQVARMERRIAQLQLEGLLQ
jgi:hypothetical protein